MLYYILVEDRDKKKCYNTFWLCRENQMAEVIVLRSMLGTKKCFHKNLFKGLKLSYYIYVQILVKIV